MIISDPYVLACSLMLYAKSSNFMADKIGDMYVQLSCPNMWKIASRGRSESATRDFITSETRSENSMSLGASKLIARGMVDGLQNPRCSCVEEPLPSHDKIGGGTGWTSWVSAS